MKCCCFLLLLACTVLLGSCAKISDRSLDASPNSRRHLSPSQEQTVRRLADQILLCLATHDYQSLELYFDPNDFPLPGYQAAARLLGPHWRSMTLDHWDARQIQVRLENSQIDTRWAVAHIPIDYRRAPNRKLRSTSLALRFYRAPGSNNWKLALP